MFLINFDIAPEIIGKRKIVLKTLITILGNGFMKLLRSRNKKRKKKLSRSKLREI